MHPTLFHIGNFTVYSYGVMVAIGFASAAIFIYLGAPKFGFDRNKVTDISIFTLISGIIGARFVYVLINLTYYRNNLFEIFDLTKGGLVWYGGFLTSALLLVIYTKVIGYNFWNLTDLMVPFVALAQAFGRIGCFLNGCCYGIEAPNDFIFKVTYPGDLFARHPTQIYSALALFMIFIILFEWQKRRRFYGEIFLGYCMLYAAERFVMEFLRGDNPRIIAGFTMSQSIAIIVLVAAIPLFWYRKQYKCR